MDFSYRAIRHLESRNVIPQEHTLGPPDRSSDGNVGQGPVDEIIFIVILKDSHWSIIQTGKWIIVG
jgi:hypothetical protein